MSSPKAYYETLKLAIDLIQAGAHPIDVADAIKEAL
jgi:chaperonin GroEL (HSP60 family)